MIVEVMLVCSIAIQSLSVAVLPKHGPAHAVFGLDALAFIPAALMGTAFGLSLF